MNKKEQIEKRRTNHLSALAALANSINPDNNRSGLQLWRKLRRIEVSANNAATAQCNGERYGGEPYRDEREWEIFCGNVRRRVAIVFGGKLPRGFFYNTDPRGYSLKLESDSVPFALERDWGGYQLLAPVIN